MKISFSFQYIIFLTVSYNFIQVFKGHMQRKISKFENFEQMKISIYKIDMQNV